MAKANHIDFAEMDVGELDELEKKLVELKKQKMKEDKAEVVKRGRQLCKDSKISATELRGSASNDRKEGEEKTEINANHLNTQKQDKLS